MLQLRELQLPLGSLDPLLVELTIIEQVLVALGIVLLDNVTEDSSTPPDTVFPVITILGDNPATVELGGTYTDAGATSDGGETVTSSGSVDTNTVGTYTISYSASDAAGNTSTATRTVNVVDTTAPVVTVTGDNPATVELGATYTDAGATATDLSGTVTVTSAGTVDTNTVGSYTITYSSTDASGNTGTATRTVNVVDTVAPTFLTDGSYSIGESTTTVGIVRANDLSGDVTFTISGSELAVTRRSTNAADISLNSASDFETKDSYTATVTADDGNGNTTSQDITVSVAYESSKDDTSPEFITSGPYTVTEGSTSVGIYGPMMQVVM